MVATIKEMLLQDWHEINFVIGSNPDDMIEIKFETSTVDTLKGLHAYMNTMMSVNPDIMRFQLRRITHYWGVREKKYVYYMLAP